MSKNFAFAPFKELPVPVTKCNNSEENEEKKDVDVTKLTAETCNGR